MEKVWISQMVQERANSMSESLCRSSHGLGIRARVSLAHQVGAFTLLRVRIEGRPCKADIQVHQLRSPLHTKIECEPLHENICASLFSAF